MAKVKAKQTISNKPKFVLFLILFAIIFVIILSVDIDDGRISGGPRQSHFDNSVDCVENYLKKSYLRDPNSYESIRWTKVIKNDDGTFQVTHTFRAKNGFGGMVEETKTFAIASNGNTIINTY